MQLLFRSLLAVFLLAACAEQVSENQDWEQENTISWNEAIRVLNEGNVVFVSQSHSLWVGFQLRDGTTFFAKEPAIDEIFREMDRCNDCGGILVSME